MSLTTFTGASQFAAVSILGAGGGVGAAVIAAVLLAARYGPIGISVAPALKGNPVTRFFHSQLVIDESWAVASRRDGSVDRERLIGAGVALYVSWQVGTIVGVFGGDLIGDPERLGLDAAFPALFLALLASQLRERRALAAALFGTAIALALVPFARPGVPVIAATLGCLAGWRARGINHAIESIP
jgi:predicted branched-subunit amino acid permease